MHRFLVSFAIYDDDNDAFVAVSATPVSRGRMPGNDAEWRQLSEQLTQSCRHSGRIQRHECLEVTGWSEFSR